MATIGRRAYAEMYGPTVGDRQRLRVLGSRRQHHMLVQRDHGPAASVTMPVGDQVVGDSVQPCRERHAHIGAEVILSATALRPTTKKQRPFAAKRAKLFVAQRLRANHHDFVVKRGVKVDLIAPGNSDHRFVQAASRATFGRLLRAGACIWERRERVFHAKVAVLDEDLVMLGSANLDSVSFRHNLELNLMLRSKALAIAGAVTRVVSRPSALSVGLRQCTNDQSSV